MSESGLWVEVDPSYVADKPYLDQYTITGLTDLGQAHQFTISVTNEIDTSESSATSIILAAVPDTPTSAPTQDFDWTTASQIKIVYSQLPSENNGGSDILGYDLWRDDGNSGDFTRLYRSDYILALSYVDMDV
jgi:hypothetical protein